MFALRQGGRFSDGWTLSSRSRAYLATQQLHSTEVQLPFWQDQTIAVVRLSDYPLGYVLNSPGLRLQTVCTLWLGLLAHEATPWLASHLLLWCALSPSPWGCLLSICAHALSQCEDAIKLLLTSVPCLHFLAQHQAPPSLCVATTSVIIVVNKTSVILSSQPFVISAALL